MGRIHATAVVHGRAELHDTVEVGPYSVIGEGVVIGEGTRVGAHVVLDGPLTIGRNNVIYPFATLGALSQDKTARPGDPTSTVIGDNNVIREYVSIQRGTMKEYAAKKGVTRVGDDNWIMAYCHVAHDCVVGNHTIFANNASLAGHAEIDDWAILGGYTLVYQFARIGAHAFTAFSTGISGDVPPFVMVQGNPAEPRAINREGLRRRGFKPEEIEAIEQAYKLIYRSGKIMAEVRQGLAEMGRTSAHVQRMLEFIEKAKRPLQR